MQWIPETSPSRKARVTGFVYLVTILAGIFAQGFVSNRLISFADASGTATRILANRGLYELSFTVYMIEMACNIAITALFYDLLKPVSRSLSLHAAFFSLFGCGIKTVSRVFYLAPLFVLDPPTYLRVFSGEQLKSLALTMLRINDIGAGMALGFFGVYALFKGWLIVRSTFLPHWLGVLSILAGFGLLAFLSPTLGSRLFPIIATVGLIGAVAQIFWLIVFGLDEPRWLAQASTAGEW